MRIKNWDNPFHFFFGLFVIVWAFLMIILVLQDEKATLLTQLFILTYNYALLFLGIFLLFKYSKKTYYQLLHRPFKRIQLRSEVKRLARLMRVPDPKVSFFPEGGWCDEKGINIDMSVRWMDLRVLMAHEMRHWWQFQKGKLARPAGTIVWAGQPYSTTTLPEWKDRPWEIDAMKFETKYAAKHGLPHRKIDLRKKK